MKSGRSIQDVSREILRQQEAKADYLVATDRLYMDTYGDSPVIRVLDREGIDQIEPLEIQQTAHQQIGTYLDIPSKYYDRMLQRDPALLSYNVNRWFQKEPEQKLLRTMDGKARAFLSNRYRRIDNLDIARVVLPIIGEMEGARFESCEITDDRMYLKVVNPRLQAEVIPGDIVQAGIMISNSETGLGAVNIQPLIYRLVCSNGMVVNEAGTRRAHIGRCLLYTSSFCKKQTENRSSSASKRTSGCLWGKPIRSIYRSVQLSMKLRTHICRAPARWPWRKLKQRFPILLRSQLKMLQILLDNFVRFYCTFRSIRI